MHEKGWSNRKAFWAGWQKWQVSNNRYRFSSCYCSHRYDRSLWSTLSFGTDMLIPRKLLELVEEKIGSEILIATEIPYGHSFIWLFFGYHQYTGFRIRGICFPGCLRTDQVGSEKDCFLNDHGGNTPMHLKIMEKLTDRGVTSLLINWWQDFWQEILSICTGQGHVGEGETSVVLAIDESLMDMSKAKVNWNKAVANVCFPRMQMQTMIHAQTNDAPWPSKKKDKPF